MPVLPVDARPSDAAFSGAPDSFEVGPRSRMRFDPDGRETEHGERRQVTGGASLAIRPSPALALDLISNVRLRAVEQEV